MVTKGDLEFDAVVVGAGVAGLAAARLLSQRGQRTVVLEKSRGVGGRMAARRLAGQSFDNGAHFFSVAGETFGKELQRWQSKDIAKLWIQDGDRRLYAGLPSMNALAKELAEEVDVERQQLVSTLTIEDGVVILRCDNGQKWRARKVLFTAPLPQSLAILKRSNLDLESELLDELARVSYEPCLSLLLRLKADIGLAAPGFLKGVSEKLDTITDARQKGTSSQPGLIVHSTAAFAEANYEKDRPVLEQMMIAAVKELYPVEIEESYLHKWRYAHRKGEGVGRLFAEAKSLPLYFAGDSFGIAKIEGAYDSGAAAAEAILRA
ncbi:FAD-dependent oxidoreductase [Pelagicoccus enzymogenes]|uniref:NAD(P)/FAD-dependent oxidoreductase n=1 Tax=Pelagicoccus enzymogenes TaxID=2773457 RepID=UPI00280F958B|nr:FAD-dependent oxidoreductase [Pelagicoccus enzymogenes]MDQ8198620.1 FAD-dependent oxidoreductase [Pelagicoccus enzymogenes]